ncbi:MAG: hypothetical protein IJL85_01540 [Erysipelotrichaceae bacterium]|nr:hypothetical protein [Erysipelotrichaceae bacterium]
MRKDIELKPKKKKKRSAGVFADKKKRYLLLFLLILPLLVAIGFFGSIVYKEVMNIKNLAQGVAEVKDENKIESMGYILRENATDLQKDYFKELKTAVEEEEFNGLKIAELVAKNYVADFYTWTNKQGSYDVGGLYYVFNGEYLNGDHFRDNVYLNAKDGFYKYINNYINDYGQENVLEVTNVEIVSSQKTSEKFMLNEHVAYVQDENEEWIDYREDHEFETYLIKCRWDYAETPLDLNKFANSINLLIIDRNGTFQIVEASEGEIDVRKTNEEVNESEEETDSDND